MNLVLQGLGDCMARLERIAALTAPQTWAIFRMIQEALFSIETYAKATRIDVSLDLRPGALLIIISDNGLGPRVAGSRSAALAMLALRERVSAYGGELSEDSAPGRGTTLTIMPSRSDKLKTFLTTH
eukprot:gene1346-1557_t